MSQINYLNIDSSSIHSSFSLERRCFWNRLKWTRIAAAGNHQVFCLESRLDGATGFQEMLVAPREA